MYMLIRDKDTDKVYEYNSGGHDTDPFTFEDAVAIRKRAVDGELPLQIYNDKDYERL